MTIETENEKHYNFRTMIEILEKDAREIVNVYETYDKIYTAPAKISAETYAHVLHLIDMHLGLDWGKKGHNNID